MTALAKLFRTTAFKLSLAYLTIFAIGSGFVLFRLGANVKALLDDQIKETIQADIRGLADQYASGGIRRLAETVENRSRQPGSSLYLLTSSAGESLVGNVDALPPGLADQKDLVETRYQPTADPGRRHLALAQVFALSGGFHLLVGRDLEERDRLRGVMVSALVTSLVTIAVVGLVGGLYVSSRVLRRIDGMTASTQRIMAGDLSGRLPVSGTGDELDRLAQNLNDMLTRIGELLSNLKEVTDNIAHDLKTPLTRLRNSAEQALRGHEDPIEYRRALEAIIDESDSLIGIFNAILMIARAEAGYGREGMKDFDAGDVVRDAAELYEPLAEERNVGFTVEAEPNLPAHGNQELLGQAIVNLVDNALKYGTVEPHGPIALPAPERAVATADAPSEIADKAPDANHGEVTVRARRVQGRIEISVCDRGAGIGAADRGRAVERFVRLEDARSKPGSGLGLSMVAAIARLHGGELRLQDNAPGLCAIITLPARETTVGSRLLAAPVPAL